MKTLTDESVLTITNVLETPYAYELREWRNQPDVRKNMLDNTEIGEKEHQAYLESLASRDDRRVYVVEDRGFPLIVLNLTVDDEHHKVNLGWHRAGERDVAPLYSVYAFFAGYDWLFAARPNYRQQDVVLDNNRSVWMFVHKCGFDLSEPYGQTLLSGARVLVREISCTSEQWLERSKRMRRMYDRVLHKAAYAQTELTW